VVISRKGFLDKSWQFVSGQRAVSQQLDSEDRGYFKERFFGQKLAVRQWAACSQSAVG
jgi:hypothetical protein